MKPGPRLGRERGTAEPSEQIAAARPSFQRKKIKMRNGKMKNYIVIWQPLSSYTASEMKVVDAFSSDSTLAIVRNDIEQRAAQSLSENIRRDYKVFGA
jgi:hypothetical protein